MDQHSKLTAMELDCQAWLQTLDETTLFGVLEELLRVMGYQRVLISHGPLEAGKDIVFLETDRIGRPIWRVIQAKAKPFTGSLTSPMGLRSILHQCEAALDSPYTDANGKQISLSEVWLVTPFPVTEFAKHSVEGKLRSQRQLHIIDGPTLAALVEHHLPSLARADTSPIEGYFDYLLDFCNLPDDYIRERLRVRFSIAQVYVPSLASLRIPTLDALTHLPPLRTRFSSLPDRLANNIRLLRCNSLPARDHFVLVRDLDRLHLLARGCFGIDGLQEWGQTLRQGLSMISVNKDLNTVDSKDTEKIKRLTDPACQDLIQSLNSITVPARLLHGVDQALRQCFTDRSTVKSQYVINAVEEIRSTSAEPTSPLNRRLVETLCASVLAVHARPLKAAEVTAIQNLLPCIDKIDASLRDTAVRQWQRYTALNQPGGVDATALSAEMLWIVCQLNLVDELLSFIGHEGYQVLDVGIVALELAAQSPRLLLQGPLGIGKTTLLKQLCVASVAQSRQQRKSHLPVFIPLSTVKSHSVHTIRDVMITNAKAAFTGIEHYPAPEIHWALDGFDEIESNGLRRKVLDWCADPDNPSPKVLLSSRPNAVEFYIPGLVRASIQPFSWDQIVRFVLRFPWDKPARAERLLKVLQSNSELGTLAQTPLLLTLIVILSGRYDPEQLPSRRDQIYERVSQLLLGDWDAAKGVGRSYSIGELPTRTAVVEKVAYVFYSMRRTSFSKREFSQLCASCVPRCHLTEAEFESLVEELVRDCVLVPASGREYKFFHLSVQEYLAAKDLCRDVNPERIQKCLTEYFQSGGSWWEEVLIFYGGVKRDLSWLIGRQLYLTCSGDVSVLLNRLLSRWKVVADLSDLERCGVVGTSVQKVLQGMDWRFSPGRSDRELGSTSR